VSGELKSGVEVVNYTTQKTVVEAIQRARSEGWQLFDERQLAANAQEWREVLRTETAELPPEWLSKMQERCANLPLVHAVNPKFAEKAVDDGEIVSLASRGGMGRTANYEAELGLADYVFMSIQTWSGASGVPIYIPSERLLAQEETVVTLMDFAYLSEFPLDERVALYQRMAFKGEDFQELLPYFMTLFYGDADRPDLRPVTFGSLQWFDKALGMQRVFHPEVKVKDKLRLEDDYRIILSKPDKSWEEWEESLRENGSKLENVLGMNIEGLNRLRQKCEGHIAQSGEDNLENMLKMGKNWWEEAKEKEEVK